jgi:DNA (cytosine-5)-methyltransferase 1
MDLHMASDCALTLQVNQGQAVTHSLRADGFDASEDGTGRGTPLIPAIAQPLRSNYRNNSNPGTEAAMHIQQGMSVRRLTPVECERLQGFFDGWTDVPYRGKPAADGPRYRAIGNSMAVPVVRWLGERIAAFEEAQGLTAEAAD